MNVDDDRLLDELRRIDPAAGSDMHERETREAVRQRMRRLTARRNDSASNTTTQLSERSIRLRRRILATAAATVAVAILGVLLLDGDDPGVPGASRALAIERSAKRVTLTITDANAPAEQMNAELARAGIDRVRVISIPGSPNHAGTWGGSVSLATSCDGGIRKIGFGVNFAYHPESGLAAPPADFIDVDLPRSRDVSWSLALQSGAGKRAFVSTESIDNDEWAPAVLIAIHPRRGDEGDSAKQLTTDDLEAMGGVFAQFGQAMADGTASCSDFGLDPQPVPVFPPAKGDWTLIKVRGSTAGAKRMTAELRAAGVKGRVVAIPAQPPEVGQWLGFTRVPPLDPDTRVVGNQLDVLTGDPEHPNTPSSRFVAIRTEAFAAHAGASWRFFVGRKPGSGEAAQIVTLDGPENAHAAFEHGCKGSPRVSEADGDKYCTSVLPAQVPDPEG